MTIGVLSIFAIGGFPAIAVACEGGGEEEKAGEEVTLVATFNGETGTITNPTKKELSIELISELENTGGGAITENTCGKGKILTGSKPPGTCTFKQKAVQGAKIKAKWL